jgi:hypothetical protein
MMWAMRGDVRVMSDLQIEGVSIAISIGELN